MVDEQSHADLVRDSKTRELAARGEFDVYTPRSTDGASKEIVRTRWVLTRKMADGKKCVKARLVAKGFQDPDLPGGLVDTSGCVSLRSSRILFAPPSAVKKWKL